jgi:hypothetical protein
MAKKTSLHFIELSRKFIQSKATKRKYRVSEKDFTRDRKLSFYTMSLCLLKLLRQNIQIELNSYFCTSNRLNINAPKSVTSSAFVQSRKKIKPEMFSDLSKIIADDFYQDNDENIKLYKGHRVLSIDGSTLNLPFSDDTIKAYGLFNNQNKTDDMVIGRVSILYDVLNEIVLDGKLCSIKKAEIHLSYEHFKYAKKGDLIIMDRAYPSFESLYLMAQQGIHTLIRCKITYSNEVKSFYDSMKKEQIIEIKPGLNRSFKGVPYDKKSRITVRLLRVVLPTGEVEILMTTLLDNKKYLYKEFKVLYFKRWAIETYYDRFKNIIGVENFSGTSDQFIQQEFNCALYMSNLQSILTKEAQEEAHIKYKNRKYEYKINSSLSLCNIRIKLIELFTSIKENEVIMHELKTLFVLNVIPVRPNRSFIRNPDKYRTRIKPKQFKNRRPVL